MAAPLLFLYNRVADNLPADWEGCTAASVLPSTASTSTHVPDDANANSNDRLLMLSPSSSGGLRVTAAHGYGTIDVNYTASADGYVTFQLLHLAEWNADPKEKHSACLFGQDFCARGFDSCLSSVPSLTNVAS